MWDFDLEVPSAAVTSTQLTSTFVSIFVVSVSDHISLQLSNSFVILGPSPSVTAIMAQPPGRPSNGQGQEWPNHQGHPPNTSPFDDPTSLLRVYPFVPYTPTARSKSTFVLGLTSSCWASFVALGHISAYELSQHIVPAICVALSADGTSSACR